MYIPHLINHMIVYKWTLVLTKMQYLCSIFSKENLRLVQNFASVLNYQHQSKLRTESRGYQVFFIEIQMSMVYCNVPSQKPL